MFLDNHTFGAVISSTPLVSIDLVVQNAAGDVLLGERLNRPAQGFWFVPGGRILKNESLSAAFQRLTLAELGRVYRIEEAILQGPFDHFYQDSVFGETPSTHYVAIAYRLTIHEALALPPEQHSAYRWFSIPALLAHEHVHPNTKAYFS